MTLWNVEPDISGHGIDLVLLEYHGHNNMRVNSLWPSDAI